MTFKETILKGAYTIGLNRHEDERGSFGRVWCKKEFAALGLNAEVVQANISYNRKKGTLRGMHYQLPPYAETKTVQCLTGSLYDVIIDLREDSDTFMQWMGVELSSENATMLYIPEGFAHGFITLEDHTSIHYMVTQYYTPEAQAGLRYDDPAFDIRWPLAPTIISEKDKNLPLFRTLTSA